MNKAPLYSTLERSCEWLALRGVNRQPLGLLEDALEGRLQVFAAVPEGAYRGLVSTGAPSAEFMASLAEFAMHPEFEPVTPGRTFQINEGRRFKRGEMVAVSPDDCVQFLQTGEAHIREDGGQEWIDAGLPDELAILLKVLHIDAFWVRGCDLEAFANEVAPTPAPSASASAVVAPAPVARPLPHQRHQEAEILRVLRELGHDPRSLPRNTPGMAGPKAAAFGRLGWKKEKRGVFDKAWDRLRQAHDIADA